MPHLLIWAYTTQGVQTDPNKDLIMAKIIGHATINSVRAIDTCISHFHSLHCVHFAETKGNCRDKERVATTASRMDQGRGNSERDSDTDTGLHEEKRHSRSRGCRYGE